MKLKATQKEVKATYYYIIGVPYCDLQTLLTYYKAFSYCSGYSGWHCDNYEMEYNGNVILISTGYNFIASKNIKKDIKIYDIIRKYEELAREIDRYDKTEYDKILFALFDEVIDFR